MVATIPDHIVDNEAGNYGFYFLSFFFKNGFKDYSTFWLFLLGLLLPISSAELK